MNSQWVFSSRTEMTPFIAESTDFLLYIFFIIILLKTVFVFHCNFVLAFPEHPMSIFNYF